MIPRNHRLTMVVELNAYEPVVATAIMESQALFYKVMPLFRTQCIDGVTAMKLS